MLLSWRERLGELPEYRNFANWPVVDPEAVPPSKRSPFFRNCRIVAQVLAGTRFDTVADREAVDRSYVSHLLKRSLGGDDREAPALTRALIPYTHLSVGVRRTPLPSLSCPAGTRGALSAVFAAAPAVKAALDAQIAASVARLPYAENLRPRSFYLSFKRLLREAHWPNDQYPFNDEALAYESLRLYLHRRTAELQMPRPRHARIVRSGLVLQGILDSVEVDEHTLDCHGSVVLELGDRLEALRLSRLTLITLRDAESGAFLAYRVCVTEHPTQFDLLSTLYALNTPWERPVLHTPGLSFSPGACLPSALGAPYNQLGIGFLRLDNALMHLAEKVEDFVCRRLGATLSFGLPGQPKTRNLIEQGFALLSDAIHRFASTTGSHPLDPEREPRRRHQRAPVLTLTALEEALAVLVTEHNVTPQARLGSHTPLEVLRHQVEQGWPRVLPDLTMQQRNPFQHSAMPTVRWIRNDKRAPHVNFEYLRYSGSGLNDPTLVGNPIRVTYDERDIRVLHAFRLDGRPLGELHPPRPWRRYPLSLTSRRYIHSLVKRKRLNMRDPLGNYFAYLLAERGKSSSATELIRVYREFHDSERAVALIARPCESELNPTPAQVTAPSSTARPSPVAPWTPKLSRRPQ